MNWNESANLSKFVWINGQMIEWDSAYISVLTHSLHYAGAVFEGERAYEGKIFKSEEHTKRLLNSAKLMNLDINYSEDEINKAKELVLSKNNLKNAYIRPLIWRGAESIGVFNNNISVNLLVLAQESNPEFQSGLRVILSPWRKIPENAIPIQAKSSAHYANIILSKKFADDKNYDDALLLDQFDNIAECSTSNIFFGCDGELVTPIADRFLSGITRNTVIAMARNIGIKVTEKRLSLGDIAEYDLCFQTGTAAEIKGIGSIDIEDKKFHFTNRKMLSILQSEYAKIVGKKL